jgi:phospholipase/carboxylesterase
MKDLPSRRAGPPPRTYAGPPHTQLDQQPDARTRAQLGRRFGGFPGVEEQPSEIRAVPGARALYLADDVAAGPPEAFISGREFAHLHALPDSSLHMVLPERLATEAVEAGWGEFHPLAGTAVPPTTLLVFAPRDPDEIDVVLRLLQRSYEFASGTR